jgi:hypothetical protein
MSQEGQEGSGRDRLTELELKVEALGKASLQELALRPSNCCNSCNNVAVTADVPATQRA